MKHFADKTKKLKYKEVRGKIIMIYREHYINTVREFYDSYLIKIITGIRCSGKLVILI